MILIDYGIISTATMFAQLHGHTQVEIDKSHLRHMILNAIRSIKVQFGRKYGELVIACDSRNSWRRAEFPHYKAARRKARNEDEIDWPHVLQFFSELREELSENFPYRVIHVDGAEADDVIGTLAIDRGVAYAGAFDFFEEGEPILIVSADHDFKQLHRYRNVKQWNSIKDEWVEVEDGDSYLFEHIVRGDPGDGIPNILSSATSFVDGVRQKPVMSKKLAEWMQQRPEEFCNETMLESFRRNETLIDLRRTPEAIKHKIRQVYDEQGHKKHQSIRLYLARHGLHYLLENLSDF